MGSLDAPGSISPAVLCLGKLLTSKMNCAAPKRLLKLGMTSLAKPCTMSTLSRRPACQAQRWRCTISYFAAGNCTLSRFHSIWQQAQLHNDDAGLPTVVHLPACVNMPSIAATHSGFASTHTNLPPGSRLRAILTAP